MLRENNKILRSAQQIVDVVIVISSFLAAYAVREHYSYLLRPLRPLSEYLFLLYLILPIWVALLYYNGAYRSLRTRTLAQTLWPVLKTVAIGGVVIMTVLFMFRLESISRALIIIFLFVNMLMLAACKALIFYLIHYIRKKGYNYRSVLIVGAGKRAEAFADVLDIHKEWGVRVVGFVDHDCPINRDRDSGKLRIIGHLGELKGIITRYQVDEVIFVVPRKWLDGIEEQILFCEQIGIKASIAADFYPHTIAKASMEELDGWPLLAFNPSPHIENAFVLKRAVDILFSFLIIILTSPFFIAAILGIKLTSRGPVFFRQERCGLNGRRFDVLKFRTMVVNADVIKDELEHLNEMSGPVFKMKNDPRVTSAGRVLRKYSLDELPQFLNVLMGDMSIVGPRPPLAVEVEKYDIWQRRRLSVRPGITCFWQVNGRNNIAFEDWMKLDLEYIDTWSLSQDFKIILKTIPAVLKGTGV